MTFRSAGCQACNEYIFDEKQVIAYQRKGGTLSVIPLDGREPWAGVFCVCRRCVETLAGRAAVNDPEPAATARLRHLDLLADAAIAGLEDRGESGWGLDGKRPFGFSGTYGIAASVLAIVGIAPDGTEEPECYSESQYQYAFGLSGDLPGHIKMRWAEFRRLTN